ncbi:MAG: hypothetical protein A2Z69_00065 [Bacteroidetes bacterium RBG_13_44_24]|nr:MAG: hypothetical protein A2Z69_00065 [Bacteroidetes bacterium RBG_13_44_24]
MLTKLFTKKKIALTLLFFFLFSFILSGPIQAFSTPESTYQFQFESAIKSEEMNLQSFVYETLKAIIGSVMYQITGPSILSGSGETGMIYSITGLIAFLYARPPASGVQYLADLGRRLEIVRPAYAQSLGFDKMEPYRELWQAFRNITYVFFVLVLVFMGFAIMFRVKINPQTVITIQSALPKVIIALVLITFSYAIVGLLIDIMFVLANLIFYTIGGLTGLKDIIDFLNRIYDLMELTPGLQTTGILLRNIVNIVPFTTNVQAINIILLAGLFPSLWIINFISWTSMAGTFVTAIPTLGLSFLIGPALDLIVIFILAIVFLIAIIRVFWSLLKAYVMVILQLIFAPFIILVGVLPGSNAISGWFRNLIANLSVFPATLAMLLISNYIVFYAMKNLFFMNATNAFFDFLTKRDATTLKQAIEAITNNITSLPDSILLSFIGLGILLLTPKVSDMIKSYMAGKPFEYGTALGEAVGPVRGVAGMALMGAGPKIAESVSYKGGKRPAGEPPSSRETGISRLTELLGKKISG